MIRCERPRAARGTEWIAVMGMALSLARRT